MDQQKLGRLLAAMKEADMPQLVLSDTYAIAYLTGHYFYPGERLLALCLFADGNHKLVLNRLFPAPEDHDYTVVWYEDTQDSPAVLASCLHPDQICGIDKTFAAGFLLRLQELGAASRFVNGSLLLDAVRQIKDEQEQEKMRISSKLNDRVMEALVPLAAQGLTEEELTARCRALYKEMGAEGVSFPPITSYGKNAADPHHEGDTTRGKRGDCVVLDIGGMKNGYASDMTRTVFLGEVSPRAREIYEVVLEANLRGIRAAKPGARMCDVDRAARDYITEKGFGPYFTHRTGHSIGMEDHEAGDVSSVNTQVIRPGQCFSVEPGIYIPEEGIGVRIEDLVLITEDGCEVLNSYPKELTVLPFEE